MAVRGVGVATNLREGRKAQLDKNFRHSGRVGGGESNGPTRCQDDFDGFMAPPPIGVLGEPDIVITEALSGNLPVGVGGFVSNTKSGNPLDGNSFASSKNP